LESARSALDAAWEAGSPFDAAVAKALAGRGARLVTKHAQQVLAGIGFTLEHPLHRYVRRARVLDGLLGDTRTLTREIGERLLADGALPAILPLTAP
ncbi:MAG TPA: acyl-CoA dehydrogenase family protein, partial [Acidimicrobiales bacterium]|nr:acyl-CoA dehydrogenase family protein [Acidimicrobiales bacterium]